MGVSMLTAMIIQSRGKDVKCLAGGPDKSTGKYVGWITLFQDGEYDHELLSSEPIYETKGKAIKAMRDFVAEIRAVDLKKERQ